MLAIRRTDVPQYLRSGSFFESLDAQDDDTFDVPTDCFKDDASVESESELMRMLQVVRYWGLFSIPIGVFEFILDNGESQNYQWLQNTFPELRSCLENILHVKDAPATDRINVAIERGMGVAVVSMLHHKGCVWNETACECAARMNDVECLMYLHTEGCPWDERTMQSAITSNSISCLQYALEFGCAYNRETVPGSELIVMRRAAVLGRVECMSVLRAAGVTWDAGTFFAAIVYNQLESVRYLHTHGCELPDRACWWLVTLRGSVEMLRYLHEEVGAELTGTLLVAAERGLLDCLRYVHEHGEPWHADVCMVAARGGHLHCLRYAREHGCPWNEETVKAAISARSLECLNYAVSHGCCWFQHFILALFLCFSTWVFANIVSKPALTPLERWLAGTTPLVNAIVFVLVLYKKHVGKYVSVRNVDRIVQSLFCLLFMYAMYTLETEMASLWVSVLRAVVFAAMVALLVYVNVYHVVFVVVGEPLVIYI